MSEELKKELRMLGVLDYKTPTVENDTPPIWVRDNVTFDDEGEPNFQESNMINRDQFMKMYDEYGECMTKLKRVQKENEKLRESYEILKREADYWEREAKKMNEKNHKLRAQLKLWKGTAP